mgnify:CR=1 FL=1
MRTAGDWITNVILWLHDTLGVVGGFISDSSMHR